MSDGDIESGRHRGAQAAHRVLSAGAALVPLSAVLIIADVAIRSDVLARWNALDFASYALAAMAGAFGWWAMVLVVWKATSVRRWLGFAVASMAALLMTTVLAASYAYFFEFRSYPTVSTLSFVQQEWRNVAETAGLVSDWVTPGNVLGFAGISGAMIGLAWVATSAAEARRPGGPSGRLLSCVVTGFVVLVAARSLVPYRALQMPPDANFPVAVVQALTHFAVRTEGRYHAGDRLPLPALAPRPQAPNVLIVLQESLSRNRMGLYGHAVPNTPELQAWAAARPEAVVVFEHAVANSGNTGVTVPTLLTGLSTSASSDDLHQAPLAWQFASAAGYQTFLASAQSFRFAAFDQFFLTTPPDQVFTAEPDRHALVNGGGMDDDVFVEALLPILDGVAARKAPFLGIVQFNATHHPILQRPAFTDGLDTSTRPGRYDNAIHVIDALFARLSRELEARGLLANTVIVLTSDHGENLGTHNTHRTQSYYETVLGIPFIVAVPDSLARAEPERVAQLSGNRGRRVQNLDVLPTVLDAMGVWNDPELAVFRGKMSGQSLFDPVSEDRVILALNNTENRVWSNEGFALVRGGEKYIFSEWNGEELYDTWADPMERTNLAAPHPERIAEFRRIALEDPWVGAILTRHLR